jgi:hypothetical protein
MHFSPNSTLKTFISALWALLTATAFATTQPAVVGKATMVIGQARLISPDGDAKALGRGADVREGDRIETGAGGHVHLKFVDGGRISVRPASRLQIENYSHTDQQPALTAIRFKLDEGVVRSITGSWGEAARDRFRLNTPLAAIGVKGTDFSVSADARQTLASVYSGAIVLTPMAEGCSATLGPCVTGSERLLSEAMKGQMLAVNGQQITPQVVALSEPSSNGQRNNTSAATSPMAAATAPAASSSTVVARNDLGAEKQFMSEARQIVIPLPSVVMPLPQVSQLQWMRWPWTQTDTTDALSQAFDAAKLKSSELTVSDGAYALMRINPEGRPLGSTEAKADFRMAGATAQLVRRELFTEVLDPVTVNGGRLSVDFTKASFSTELNVSSDRIGSQSLSSSGSVQANGVISGTTGNTITRGALSTDGREAGYFFSSNLPAGQVRGITLWGR